MLNEKATHAYEKQDYSGQPVIDGVQIVNLRRFNDDGGAMTELGRMDGGIHQQLPGFEARQINYSVVEPGSISE